MLRGRIYRLSSEILAIETVDGKRTAVALPVGAVLRVVSGPSANDTRMVDVEWNERRLVMFLRDLHDRCEDVSRTGSTIPNG